MSPAGRTAIAASFGAFLLSSCTAPRVSPYAPPAPAMPERWSEPTATRDTEAREIVELRHWWTAFRDPLLDRLMDRAIADSLDLKIVSQRLLAARAERDVVAAARMPTLGISARASVQRSSTRLDYPPGIGVSDALSAELDASWEPDLFGRLRHAVDAAEAEAGALEEDRRAILVTLLAEIAIDYIDLRSTRERMAIAERDISRLKATVDATARLRRGGLAGGVELAQARAEWQAATARLPAFRVRIARDSHAIGVLTGGFPGDVASDLAQAEASLPGLPIAPASVPSQLLRDRPDIRAVERRVAAATARVNMASADLFPHFRIPLTLGTAASGIGALVAPGSILWSVTAAGSQTLFDKGQREARLRAMQALNEAQRLDYERNVHAAVRDVEDALAASSEEAVRQAALMAALSDNRVAVDRANKEYHAGTISTLDLLKVEQSLYAIEDAVAESRAARLNSMILLSKALGGGWQDAYPDTAPTS